MEIAEVEIVNRGSSKDRAEVGQSRSDEALVEADKKNVGSKS